jgi:hypothetical protein
MISSAQDLAAWLSRFAAQATEIGYTKRCHIEIRIDSGGLMIVARSQDGAHQAVRLVEWSDVLAHRGAMATALDEVVGDLGLGADAR